MGKSNFMGGGPFDAPSGQAKTENPDGVSQTYGAGEVCNSLTNSTWACGGPDGNGNGLRRDNEGGLPMFDPYPNRNPGRLRIG